MTHDRSAHFDKVWRARIETGDGQTSLADNKRALKALALLKPGERILDVGCGTGALGKASSVRFTEVHGVDISSTAVLLAQQCGVRAQVVDAGSESLPFGDGHFDAVVSMSVLQYVLDLEKALSEFRRVLRPGGQLIAAVPNMRALWRVWKLTVRGTFPRTSVDSAGCDDGALHYFTHKTARDWLTSTGFNVVGAYGVFCIPGWLENHAESGWLGDMKREFLSAEIVLDARSR